MTALPVTVRPTAAGPAPVRRGLLEARRRRAGWARTLLVGVITLVALVPILVVVWLALRPRLYSGESGPTLSTFAYVFRSTNILWWLRNSLIVALTATVARGWRGSRC
jgi:multiple sugar transport system permease protein